MKIYQVLDSHRNDFAAIYQCEHCERVAFYQYGYSDSKFHNEVIPAMKCPWCGKNRDGNLDEKRNGIIASHLQKAEKFMRQVEGFKLVE